MSEQNKALLRRGIEEIWNQGNYVAMEEVVASDFHVHGPTPEEDTYGREPAAQFFIMLRQAFPDLHFTIEDMVAEGDRVVTRWVAHGTHRGEFQGIPPTGRRVTFNGIDVDRIADGKVAECWPGVDQLSLLQQLGALPAQGAATQAA